MHFFLLMSVSILGSFAESLTETTQSKERMRIFLAFVNMCMPRDQTGIHNKHVQIFFCGQQMAFVHAQECRKWDRHRGRCSGENWLYFVPTGLEISDWFLSVSESLYQFHMPWRVFVISIKTPFQIKIILF